MMDQDLPSSGSGFYGNPALNNAVAGVKALAAVPGQTVAAALTPIVDVFRHPAHPATPANASDVDPIGQYKAPPHPDPYANTWDSQQRAVVQARGPMAAGDGSSFKDPSGGGGGGGGKSGGMF